MSKTSRQEILELLAQGKISAGEAAEMLNLVETAAKSEHPRHPDLPAPPPKPLLANKQPRWFKVRVRDLESGQNKISVNIPIRMLKFGLKMGSRFAPELNDMNFNNLESMILEGGNGMLVEVEDEEKNEHVRVYLE